MKEKRIPRDQEDRELILNEKSHCIVLASAGSGKTTILVKKLMKEARAEIKHFNYVAITFTNKAALEIKERLSKNSLTNAYASTIDGFVENEIIRNFVGLYITGLSDYEQSYDNKHKLRKYNELVNLLGEENILGSYADDIQKHGKNFKFELALNILEKVQVSREYIKYKYKMIFIDEYQDCDESMNNLFQFLKRELNIRLFIVGDMKQSIYQWRGASPTYLEQLTKDKTFKNYTLTENFRSKPSIVDFSLAISEGIIVDKLTDEKDIYYYNPLNDASRKEIIDKLLVEGYIDLNKQNIILGGSNKEIENLHEQLDGTTKKHFTYIKRNDISSCPNRIILEEIAKYYFNKNYTEYDFIGNFDIDYNRKYMKDLHEKLEAISKEINEYNIEEIFNNLNATVGSFNKRKETEILTEVLNNPLNSVIYGSNSKYSLIMTTHASKGLEADTVIIFTENYFDKFAKTLKKEENYVGVTRAENKLILIDNGLEMYRRNIEDLLIKNNSNRFSFEDFINEIT